MITINRSKAIEAGSWIKSEILKRGMNQAEFAKQLSRNSTQVTEMDISRLIAGRSKPPFWLICLVADALDTDPNFLAEKWGLWRPKKRIGDPRLDRAARLSDRLTPIKRELFLALIDAAADTFERQDAAL